MPASPPGKAKVKRQKAKEEEGKELKKRSARESESSLLPFYFCLFTSFARLRNGLPVA
jgi:hypothetical protein